MINLVGRLGEVDKHCVLVHVLSLGVVPDSVAVHTICVLVYQHVPAHTCTTSSSTFINLKVCSQHTNCTESTCNKSSKLLHHFFDTATLTVYVTACL